MFTDVGEVPMRTVTGVFKDRGTACRAVERLVSSGIPRKDVNLLSPGDPGELATVPTADGEQPGMGPAIGAVVGAASGSWLGLALSSVLIPGIGAVTVAGMAGLALFGAGGAAAGAGVGKLLENNLEGEIPHDELFVYEDALKQGRSVVLVMTDEDKADETRRLLGTLGTESIDPAREQQTIGVQDPEDVEYPPAHGEKPAARKT